MLLCLQGVNGQQGPTGPPGPPGLSVSNKKRFLKNENGLNPVHLSGSPVKRHWTLVIPSVLSLFNKGYYPPS